MRRRDGKMNWIFDLRTLTINFLLRQIFINETLIMTKVSMLLRGRKAMVRVHLFLHLPGICYSVQLYFILCCIIGTSFLLLLLLLKSLYLEHMQIFTKMENIDFYSLLNFFFEFRGLLRKKWNDFVQMPDASSITFHLLTISLVTVTDSSSRLLFKFNAFSVSHSNSRSDSINLSICLLVSPCNNSL